MARTFLLHLVYVLNAWQGWGDFSKAYETWRLLA
jgi:hypothetical protein